MNNAPKRLPRRDYEAIIDRLPKFQDRVKMHDHEIATRLTLEKLEGPQEGPAVDEAALRANIVKWIRTQALDREATVRGKQILRIADAIEAGEDLVANVA